MDHSWIGVKKRPGKMVKKPLVYSLLCNCKNSGGRASFQAFQSAVFEENQRFKFPDPKADQCQGNVLPQVFFLVQMRPFEDTYTCFLEPGALAVH